MSSSIFGTQLSTSPMTSQTNTLASNDLFSQMSSSPPVNNQNSASSLLADLDMSSLSTNPFPNPIQTNPMQQFNPMPPQSRFPAPNYGGNHFNPMMTAPIPPPFQNPQINNSFAGMNLSQQPPQQPNPMQYNPYNQQLPPQQFQQQRPAPALPPFQQQQVRPPAPNANQNNSSLNSIQVPW